MSDPLRPCESWAEAISLLAAGCLTPEAQPDVRQHLATCAACRQQSEQLASVCQELHRARPVPAPLAAEVVSRVMANIAERSTAGRPAAWWYSKRSRWLLTAGAALAASWLAVVVWRSFVVALPQVPQVVSRHRLELVRPSDERPKSEVDTGPAAPLPGVPGRGSRFAATPEVQPGVLAAATSGAAAGPPNWLALQRAFAQSDEEFDTLLARHSEAIACAAVHARSLFQESCP